jgi:hypothetical protein
MEPFIRYLEARSAEDKHLQGGGAKPLVKEWGLSHTTLEDVFLEVTKRENFTYQKQKQPGKKKKRRRGGVYRQQIVD